MIEVQLKNKYIYFALEGVWNELDYRFKYQINQLVTANSDDEYIQTIQVDKPTLGIILNSVNNKPQGCSREINPEMFMFILPQIQALANLGNEEAISILQGMQAVTLENDALKNAKILNGKTQILA